MCRFRSYKNKICPTEEEQGSFVRKRKQGVNILSCISQTSKSNNGEEGESEMNDVSNPSYNFVIERIEVYNRRK